MYQDSQIRWLVAAFAATAVAVMLAAPAGARPILADVGDETYGVVSVPAQQTQKSAVHSNLVHEGVQAERRHGVYAVADESTATIRDHGRQTYVPGVTDSTTGVMAQARQNARDDVVTDKAAPAGSSTERYIPGVTDSTTGVMRNVGVDTPVVAEPTAVSDDGGRDFGNVAIGLTAALATALLMALASFALVQQRRRRVAAL